MQGGVRLDESKLVPPRPKVVSSEEALSLAEAKLDRVLAQKAKLSRTAHITWQRWLGTEIFWLEKQLELLEVEVEYRAACLKRLTPTQSVAPSFERHSDQDELSLCHAEKSYRRWIRWVGLE